MKLALLLLVAMVAMACGSRHPAPEPGDPEMTTPDPGFGTSPIEGILAAGQPTEDELRAAASAGFKTVINLRDHEESGAWDESELVESLGMTYVHLPVRGKAGVNDEAETELSRALNQAEQPVLLHCGSSNRVGALLAMRAATQGQSIDEAMELGRRAGMTSLESHVETLLRERTGD